MPTARYDASAVVLDEILLVFGGKDESFSSLSVCEKFHLGMWHSIVSMLEPLDKPLVASAGGKVFIVPQSNSPNKIQQYDPKANSFSWVAQIPDDISDTWYASLVAADENLYLLGGEQRLAVQYNPATDQWVQLLHKPAAKYNYGCCAVVQFGKILLCGGSNDDSNRNMAEEYDLQTQQWKRVDLKLPFPFNSLCCHVASIRLYRL